MKNFIRLLSWLIIAPWVAGVALAQSPTDYSGLVGVFRQPHNGNPQQGLRVTFSRNTFNGELINLGPVSYTTDKNGKLFTSSGDTIKFRRLSTVYVECNVAGYNVTGGVQIQIPDSATFDLAALQPPTPFVGGHFNIFSKIKTITGTYPVADAENDSLTLVSTDNSVGIAGTASTDRIDFTIPSLSITNAKISPSAGIAVSKLATGTPAQMIVLNSSGVPTYVTPTGDVSVSSSGVFTVTGVAGVNYSIFKTIDTPAGTDPVADGDADVLQLLSSDLTITGDATTDAITFVIPDLSLTNTKISATAAIALSKLASGASAQIPIANGSGVPTYRDISGDATITNLGVLSVADDSHNHTTTTISGLDASVDLTTGFVPLARGGLGQSISSLNNGRVIISSGNVIGERDALASNALVVGSATLGVTALPLSTANYIVGMNAGASANEYKQIAGTSNQVTVTHGVGSIIFSTPQSIATTSLVQFSRALLDTLRFANNAGVIANDDTVYFFDNSGVFQFKLALDDVPSSGEVLKISSGRIASWQADATGGGGGGGSSFRFRDDGGLVSSAGSVDFRGGLQAVSVGSDSINVFVIGTDGIKADTDSLRVLLSSNSGLYAKAGSGAIDSLQVRINGGTLERTSTGLRVPTNGITTTQLASMTSSEFAGEITNETGTAGALVFSISPTIATPIFTGAITFPTGVRQTFAPDATLPGLNWGTLSADPSNPANGDVWYRSDTGKFRGRQNGSNVDFIGSATASWNSLTAPTGAMSMQSDGITELMTFDFRAAYTGGSFYTIEQTTGNPSDGILLDVHTTDEDIIPMRITAQGTNDGVQVNSSGELVAIGGGGIDATSFNGEPILIDSDVSDSLHIEKFLTVRQTSTPLSNNQLGFFINDADNSIRFNARTNSGDLINVTLGAGSGATDLDGLSDVALSSVATNQILIRNAGNTDFVNKTMSGDATLASTGALTLAATGVSAGSYTAADITVDAKGRITAAASGAGGTGDITAVVAGTGLSGGATSGSATLNFDATELSAVTWGAADATWTFDATTGTNPTLAWTDAKLIIQGQLDLKGVTSEVGTLTLWEETGVGTDKVSILAPSDISATYDIILPTAQGAANSLPMNNGSGALSWTTTIPFTDTDNNWTATTLGAALEELDDVINGGVPNATTGKVDWSQLVNVPAGFADGDDDTGGGGGGGGSGNFRVRDDGNAVSAAPASIDFRGGLQVIEPAADSLEIKIIAGNGLVALTDSLKVLRKSNRSGLAFVSDSMFVAGLDSTHITNAAIAATDLANGLILNAKLASSSVDSNKVAASQITTTDIKDGNILTADLASQSVTGAKIALAVIDSTHITNAAIAATDIANSAILNAKIASSAVDSNKVATGAITTTDIRDATINTGDLASSSVTLAKLASNSVDSTKILNVAASDIVSGAILNAKIATAAIDSTKIAASQITTSLIKDGNVNTVDLANNSVTGAKIQLGSDAQGDVMYYNGTDWARLGAGTSGYYLKTNGTGANPSWAEVVGGGGGSSNLDFVFGKLSAAQTTNISAGDHVKWNTLAASSGSSITLDISTTYSTTNDAASIGRFTISETANYEIRCVLLAQMSATPDNFFIFHIYDATSGTAVSNEVNAVLLSPEGGNSSYTVSPETFFRGQLTSGHKYEIRLTDVTDLFNIDNSSSFLSITKLVGGGGAGDITSVIAGDGLRTGSVSGDATVDLNPKLSGQTIAITSDSVHVKSASLDSTHIKTSGIAASDIASGAILTAKLAASVVDSVKIKDGSINSADIRTAAIGPTQLAPTAVTAGSYTSADITVDADGRITAAASGSGGSGDITAVVAGNGLTGGATSGSATLDVNPKLSGVGRMIITGDSLLVHADAIDSTRIIAGTVAASDLASSSVLNAKIAVSAVDSTKIAASQVTTTDIKDANVNTADLASQAVTGAKIALATLDSTHITNVAIAATDIANAAILNAKIANSAVDSNKVAVSMITTTDIKDGNINTADLAASSVTNAKVAAGAVDSSKVTDVSIAATDLVNASVLNAKIAPSAVDSTKIKDSNVTTLDIKDGNVNTADLAASAVTNAKVAAGAIDSSKVTDLSIAATDIVNAAILNAKIANSAVDSNKVKDSNITTLDIKDGNVNTADLAAQAVSGAKIKLAVIDSTHITDGAIAATDIKDAAILNAKLAASSVDSNKVAASMITTTDIKDATINTADLAARSVTFAKMQSITDARLLGRSAGSAGDMQEITVGSGLSLSGGSLTASASSPTWDIIGDAAGNGSIGFGDTEQIIVSSQTSGDVTALTLDINQVDDAAATDDLIAFSIDATSESGDAGDTFTLMRLLYENGTANTVLDRALLIDNAETTASTMTDAILITSSGVNGGVVDAIDVSAANITNAINIGANDILTAAATIASTELDRLDGKDAALIDLNDSPVITGAWDAGGATSFEIPNGSNPTVSAAGQISIDSEGTTESAVRFYADAEYVLPARYSKSFTIISPVAADDYPVWKVPYAIHIVAIHVLVVGGTNVVGGLDEADGNGASSSAIDADITGSAGTNANDDGSLTNPTLDAADYLMWHTTSVSGSVTSVTITFEYTVDAVN